MRPAPLPKNEAARLAAVRELALLDTAKEERFDRISRLVQRLYDVPIAFIALVDANRQWFKSCIGLSIAETPREISFCAHTILGDEPLVIQDALLDARFHDNPLVAGPPHIRFYAGQPLEGPDGLNVGTLCIIDQKPRRFEARDADMLRDLGAMVERELNLAETIALQQELIAAREAAEKLLLNILPASVAQRLKQRQGLIADYVSEATVLFADMHDFSRRTEAMSPTQVVETLNHIFSLFDDLAQARGLERIKTIGDAYIIAGGVPNPLPNHAECVADMALAMQREMAAFETPQKKPFNLRIGLATGPVIAGVLGKAKFSYDVWGEAVDTAWQMALYGAANCIQVNETTCEILQPNFIFESRGEFYVKGKGQVKTFFLKGRRQELA